MMCGIAGFWDPHHKTQRAVADIAQDMGRSLLHRGPDAGDYWHDSAHGLALVHRRLSIVDLSPAGAQPMVSSCGRFVICYNGEVYNTASLHPALAQAGRHLRGHSDTEVILEHCAAYGVANTVRQLVGMFAFALWDRQTGTLTLVRDRLGIKPLYWSLQEGILLFGSELKALRAHPHVPFVLDRSSVAAFLRYKYIPAPHTIWQGVQKLLPGHMLILHADDAVPQITEYWNLQAIAAQGQQEPFAGSDADAVDQLHALLLDAVGARMVADVPLGAFLSGGIDSSTVVALMQAQSARPVKTFSIGFAQDGYNEADHAKAVAAHLGTDHTELYITPKMCFDVIPRLPEMYDEPFADVSQIPTFLVSQLARQHVTVSLSGDGGDELFGGYNRYLAADKMARLFGRAPVALRRGLAAGMRAIPTQIWDILRPRMGEKVHKIARVLPLQEAAFYRALVSDWQSPVAAMQWQNWPEPQRTEHGTVAPMDAALCAQIPGFIARMQYVDLKTYLPDDILTKVDRASMAASLEARVPLLDHRVAEFAWQLPAHMKLRQGQGKWILRQVMQRYLPDTLMNRPKMGFGVPMDHWLRGDLKEWAADYLSAAACGRYGVVQGDAVERLWRAHQKGQALHHHQLWSVLMLHSWMDAQGIAL